jgi:ABC-type sugar transport system ATPase subunit
MLSETRCLQKQLKNNFYVTHDQEEAMVISERWFAVRDTLNYIPD